MAGPREWSPRRPLWVLIIDSREGNDAEIFLNEKSAYHYAAGLIMDSVEEFEAEDLRELKGLMKEKKYDEVVVFYHDALDRYGVSGMTYYSIVEKEVN